MAEKKSKTNMRSAKGKNKDAFVDNKKGYPNKKVRCTSYSDAFFINISNETVTWIYYNPDSDSRGQFVTNNLTFPDITSAISKNYNTADEFFDYLGCIAYQTLADRGTEWFEGAKIQFFQNTDIKDCTEETIQKIIKAVTENMEVRDV